MESLCRLVGVVVGYLAEKILPKIGIVNVSLEFGLTVDTESFSP